MVWWPMSPSPKTKFRGDALGQQSAIFDVNIQFAVVIASDIGMVIRYQQNTGQR